MTNKKNWLGMLAITLVFGMAVIGCDDGSTDNGTDPLLNGTWVTSEVDIDIDGETQTSTATATWTS